MPSERKTVLASASRALFARATGYLKYARTVVTFVWTHPANEGAQCRALLRAAQFQFRARVLHKLTITKLGQRSVIRATLRRGWAAKVVYANPPDHREMLVWRKALRPGDLFIDIGANIGVYSIWAGELGASVIALEPADDTFSLLMGNIVLNAYPITAMRAAAGASCGTARFTEGQDDRNRLDPYGCVETQMVTIDSVIGDRAVAGMKIDVEGFEIDVLRGCERALSEGRIHVIQLEWNETSVIAVDSDRKPVAELLTKYGYKLYRPGPGGELCAISDDSFGPDVFACPDVTKEIERPGSGTMVVRVRD